MTPEQIAVLDEFLADSERYIEVGTELLDQLAAYKAAYPDDFTDLEQADNQRELVFSFNKSMEAKESA